LVVRKLCNRRLLAGMVVVFCALFGAFDVENVEAQTTNSWTNSASGFWHTVANTWSLGRIPTNTDSIFITNSNSLSR